MIVDAHISEATLLQCSGKLLRVITDTKALHYYADPVMRKFDDVERSIAIVIDGAFHFLIEFNVPETRLH